MKHKRETPLLRYLRNQTKAEREALAARANTSVMYLYQLGTGFRNPSREKAETIEAATDGVLTKVMLLFPEDFA